MLVGAALSPLDRFLVIPSLVVLLCPVAYIGLRKVCSAA
jgi:hypothetical protein